MKAQKKKKKEKGSGWQNVYILIVKAKQSI